jgi:hypothetical protein
MVGQTLNVDISYDVSDDNANLTGLGLNIHYDSSLITFVALSYVFQDDVIQSAGPYIDVDNLDENASTDMYASIAWASLDGDWPGVLPETLATVGFMVEEAAKDVDSVTIDFSSTSNAVGYAFQADSEDINVISATYDFDGNGNYDALSDGLLLVRYAFGLRGDRLVNNQVIADNSPLTHQEIEAKIEEGQEISDIDGNGNVDALSDGLLLLRHLFGFTGESLVDSVVHSNGSRQTHEEVTAYMNGFMPAGD